MWLLFTGESESASSLLSTRVSPEHKARIDLAKKKVEVIVAMTGDGINDAIIRLADHQVLVWELLVQRLQGASDMVL